MVLCLASSDRAGTLGRSYARNELRHPVASQAYSHLRSLSFTKPKNEVDCIVHH